MKSSYELRERTPTSMQCCVGACPAIYSVETSVSIKNLRPNTPLPIKVGSVNENHYLIIGNQLDPRDFGLEKKVEEGEILISVPKLIIDEMQREMKEKVE